MISLSKKEGLHRLLAYMVPGVEDRRAFRSVAHLDAGLVQEAIEEHLITRHRLRRDWYALTRRGYEALESGRFRSYRKPMAAVL